MLDLTHFILNSSSLTEPPINTQDIPGVDQALELADDSVDKDNLILDPSSFVLLFAEILANIPVKSEVDSDSSLPVSGTTFSNSILADSTILNTSTQEELTNKEGVVNEASFTNKINVTSIENQINSKNELPINKDIQETTSNTRMNNADHLTDTIPVLLDTPLNTEVQSEQPSLNSLENNVAMVWINSKSFQPPQSVSTTNEFAEEFLPELETLQLESAQLPEIELKKDETTQYDKVLEPINTKTTINAKEDLSKGMQLPNVSSEKNSSKLTEEPTIGSPPSGENTQYLVQPNALANNESQTATEIPVKSLEIPVDLANSQWANKFSEHITWLGHQGIKSALIKIHPEDLGPLEISIKVVKDSASVNINSHNSHVRDIVDQALPKLREMMAEQGLNLSDVHIGSDTNPRHFSHNNAPSEEIPAMSSDDEVQLIPLTKKTQEGIIDYFA
ncbi:flagellar hook-length control protein FliK [Legionella maioricensis]|uniref:Flagellar hook-length control protein FliK n=1 Tax=Legionella maioricensis TaxID=2896528 RepID=A0A9X2IAX3_9GAMM|nr:flagellar hook-length control protein FliK [Legionella maioricensis]MCL9683736.1 flagellar hook-length control protein FliK [Legionella maioricensis]MCL9687510.1 flagellar hook-length control protein FliK [Legionella maioricensis]